jgi:hypothetical protein
MAVNNRKIILLDITWTKDQMKESLSHLYEQNANHEIEYLIQAIPRKIAMSTNTQKLP